MSKKHPIISVTGSSGAGTTTVKTTFDNIFRREGITAASIEGDAFHRFDRAAMAAELKRRGFRFVGPTTAYATMRACGVVNDHLVSCASHLADGFAQVDVSSGAIAATTARSPTSHGTSYSSRTASQRTAS